MDPRRSWETFNYSLILMVGGLLVLFYRSWREERPDHHVILIWSVFMLIAAWQHIRYEYYLAVNIAVLSGICIGFVFRSGMERYYAGSLNLPRKEEPEQTISSKSRLPRRAKNSPQKEKSPGRHHSIELPAYRCNRPRSVPGLLFVTSSVR